MIDLHCHLLPQIDDGSRSLAESLEMARATAKSDHESLYDRDFNLWVEEQLALLEAGAFERLDLANLIEEIADMARSQRKAIRSDLVVLFTHLRNGSINPKAAPPAGPVPSSSTGGASGTRSTTARAWPDIPARSSSDATLPPASRRRPRAACPSPVSRRPVPTPWIRPSIRTSCPSNVPRSPLPGDLGMRGALPAPHGARFRARLG